MTYGPSPTILDLCLVWEHGSVLVPSEVTSFLSQIVKVESSPLIAFKGVKGTFLCPNVHITSSVVIALPNPALRELSELQ